jgi:pimeloyl-ACP methyl ester carboxylesterase
LPGHGASPDAATNGFESIVNAVESTLSSMGSEFHLVGHSLGAAVAIALSLRSGLKIKSMTLFAPAGLGTTVDGDFVAGFLSAKSEAALSAQMKKLVNDPASLPASMVKATQAAREAGPINQRQAHVAAGLFEGSTQLFSVRSELSKYQGPCRIVLGQRDGIIPPSETDRNLPAGIALHRFESAGHLPFLEEQALSARLIAETVRSSG